MPSGRSAPRETVDHTPNLIELAARIADARRQGRFRAYCTEINIHTRKAYDLMVIAEALDEARLKADDVFELGWSKARLVATHARTRREIRRAVTFARINTLAAVVAYFKTGTETALITKSFHLTADEAEELDAALGLAGGDHRKGRFHKRSAALMNLVREYRKTTKTNNTGDSEPV